MKEDIYFQYIRRLDGRPERIGTVKRNGKLVPRFTPDRLEAKSGGSVSRFTEFMRLVRELMYSLNRVQRRTWALILRGHRITDVASQERVSSPAIYARIRGNSKGQGGMIRKNDYVWIWWRDQHKP